jgi:cytochrome c551/c552
MKKMFIIVSIVATSLTVGAVDVKPIWEKDCAKCHGVDGKGETKMGQKVGIRNMSDVKIQSEMTETNMVKAIKEGVKDKEDKTKMKAFPDLTNEETKGLVEMVRGFKK